MLLRIISTTCHYKGSQIFMIITIFETITIFKTITIFETIFEIMIITSSASSFVASSLNSILARASVNLEQEGK